MEQADDVLAERLEFGRHRRLDIGEPLDLRLEKRLPRGELPDADAGYALAEQQEIIARDADRLMQHTNGSDSVEILGAGRIYARIELRNHRQGAVLAQ